MTERLSLHLGVNKLNADHYTGFDGPWEGSLLGCEHDATDLEAVASAQGFTTSTMLGTDATVSGLIEAVSRAAGSLASGDIFLLTFSGYGGEVPDRNNDDRWRERTWALYDRQLPEDELTSLVTPFGPNVRVLIVDDSSSSGTVRRDIGLNLPSESDLPVTRERALPPAVAAETYGSHRTLYDEIQQRHVSGESAAIRAAVLILRGFGENQFGEETNGSGLFTRALITVWAEGRFRGDYRSLVERVAARMPPIQTPQLVQKGSGASFARERPFS